jgi:hypothetical protein
MLNPVRHRRLLASLLLLALMLQSLLPAIAGSLSGGSGRWIEVCASSGVKWVKLDQQTAAGEHAGNGHCLLCAATGAAPDFDVHHYLQADACDARPTWHAVPTQARYPGHALQSRAPPLFS